MPIKRAPKDDPCRCENCAHFYQHYYIPKLLPIEYRACSCGHCHRLGRRTVKPEYVCERFESESPKYNVTR